MKFFNYNLIFILAFSFLPACTNAKESISNKQKLDFIMLIKFIAEVPPKDTATIEKAINIKFDKLINKALEKNSLLVLIRTL